VTERQVVRALDAAHYWKAAGLVMQGRPRHAAEHVPDGPMLDMLRQFIARLDRDDAPITGEDRERAARMHAAALADVERARATGDDAGARRAEARVTIMREAQECVEAGWAKQEGWSM